MPSHSQNGDHMDGTDSQGQPGNYFNIPAFIVFSHNFYRTTDNRISDVELDKQYSTTINGETQTIYSFYSLKGQSLDTGIVLKIGNMYRYYEAYITVYSPLRIKSMG